MGKPKKSKKIVEDNEFLKDLIDEVKSIDGSDDEDSDESLSGRFDVLGAKTSQDSSYRKIDAFLSDNLAQNEEEQLPTVFAHIKKDIRAPKLKQGESAGSTSNPESEKANDKTVPSIDQSSSSQDTSAQNTMSVANNTNADRTVAVEGARGNRPLLQEKVVSGSLKGTRSGQVYTSLDASLAQAETLKIAQSRIKELEIEIDRLRQENDDLASAGDVVTRRMEDLQIRLHRLEKEKGDLQERSRSELLILKGNLQYKETELSKTKARLEDLDLRVKSDFRKIRVRERELENRLELVRSEKQALMRSKDEKILDLQRKLDQYKSELDMYRAKVQDLNKTMESQHDQMQKTIRALRIALINLEHDESSTDQGNNSSSEDDSGDERKKSS